MKNMEPFIRLFVTSRLNVNLQLKFPDLLRLEVRANSSDIEAYLISEMNTNNRMSIFTAKDPKLKGEIITNVKQKADGM